MQGKHAPSQLVPYQLDGKTGFVTVEIAAMNQQPRGFVAGDQMIVEIQDIGHDVQPWSPEVQRWGA